MMKTAGDCSMVFQLVLAIDGDTDDGKEMDANHLVLKDSSVAVRSSIILLVFCCYFWHLGWMQFDQLAWSGNNMMSLPCP